MNWLTDKAILTRTTLTVLKLVDLKPRYQRRGICNSVVDVVRDQYQHRPFFAEVDWEVDIFGMDGWEYIALRQAVLEEVYAQIEHWPHKSGYVGYPIKSPNPAWTPHGAFVDALDNDTMWDKSTEYGQLRWDLLAYLITEFTKTLPAGNKDSL
jgi:hypothetical protein